jgi:hypothetical protein
MHSAVYEEFCASYTEGVYVLVVELSICQEAVRMHKRVMLCGECPTEIASRVMTSSVVVVVFLLSLTDTSIYFLDTATIRHDYPKKVRA